MNGEPLSCHEATLMALGEINPRVAEVMEAIGSTASGHPLPGLAGWLPLDDLLTLAQALIIAHSRPTTCHWNNDADAETLATWMREAGAWRNPRPGHDVLRLFAGMSAYVTYVEAHQ